MKFKFVTASKFNNLYLYLDKTVMASGARKLLDIIKWLVRDSGAIRGTMGYFRIIQRFERNFIQFDLLHVLLGQKLYRADTVEQYSNLYYSIIFQGEI